MIFWLAQRLINCKLALQSWRLGKLVALVCVSQKSVFDFKI